jgi:uncharacterized protein
METNNIYCGPRWVYTWLGGLLIVFVAFLIVNEGYKIGQNFNQGPENTISISAEGKVSATPDTATVNLGILVEGDTAEEVQDESSEKINKVVAFVEGQGINENDIQTSGFNINPRYNYTDGKSKIIGYQASQSVVVKIKNIDESSELVGQILSGATDNGANQINGVSFGLDDPDELKNQARKLAIANAKEKASELAKEAGLKLGKIVSLSESGGNTPFPYVERSVSSDLGIGGGGVAPNIQPGSQEITQTMTITFELR